MNNVVVIKDKIKPFISKINEIMGDKSISIRFLILSSFGYGTSKAKNLSISDDILNTIECLRKLGIKIQSDKNNTYVQGVGIDNFLKKKNISLNAGNSGTAARLLASTLVRYDYPIKITGDNSLIKEI